MNTLAKGGLQMILEDIRREVINGDDQKVLELIASSLREGFSVHDILNKALIGGMMEVGEMFIRQEIYLPEMLFASRAMQEGLKILEPLLISENITASGKIILGTVKDDVHDIGKNLVGMMFKGAGFEVIDLGVDVSPQKFAAAVKEHNPDLVGMSSLLGTTMRYMKDTLEAIRTETPDSGVKVMVGGAIITQEFADKIGADGYAPDAASAVIKARELLQSNKE
jgi:5-methyltetrahydrofolate--homocysteine methyltransferase